MTGPVTEITSGEAWRILSEIPDAVLIDVRTTAEWAFVGVCDLESLGKQVLYVSWQTFPDMAVNADFCEEIERADLGRHAKLLFLCRSGQRSHSAATAIAQRGYENCFNISDGFEGDKDDDRRRNAVNGWRMSGLPWVQQ